MPQATLRSLIMDKAHDGTAIIDHLLNDSGILKTALAVPANDGILHKFKKTIALPAFSFRTMGGEITDDTVESKLEQVDLKILDVMQSENIDFVDNYKGGKAKYFRDQFPAFAEAFGQAAAKQLVYGIDSTFGDVEGYKGWHALAKEYNNVVQKGGASGSTTSIFAVKYNPAYCAVLFNPNYGKSGKFLKVTPINGGNPVTKVTNTTTGASEIVYQITYGGYLAFMSGTSYDVAAITQIQDADNDKPLAADLDTILDKVKAGSNTFLYANRLGRRLVKELKDSKLELGVLDKDYSTKIDFWEGIPFVTDENIVSNETSVLD